MSTRLLALLALVGLFALPAAGPVGAAQAQEWEIRSFDADIVVAADGSLEVTETIAVVFHVPSRGIYREIPFRVPVDGDTVRRYRFDRIEVATSPGAPDDLAEERSGQFLVWRIGDPDTDITGEHTYTISYRVRGALNRFGSHDELFWNVTGDRWQVPIQRASATVHAPAITEVRCFAGSTGQDDPCPQASHDDRTATFAAANLTPGQQLDVVVAMPPGTVEVAPPELEPASPVARAFHADPPRVAGGTIIGLAGLAGVVALARRGRDERAEPAAAGALPGGVEYRPPENLRPAQLRTLLSQRVDETSLSSTVVDLAVRGHLRIEEVERTGLGRLGGQDWIIHRQPDPPAEPLEPFEQDLLRGLFGAGLDKSSVKVSELGKGKFHSHYQAIKKKLYADVVTRGYFRHDPSQVRTGSAVVALLVLGAGVAGIVAMFALDWTLGLVVAPLPVVGLLLLLVSQWAPRRTASGAAMNQRAQGFREFVRTAEADRMAFAEREQIFTSYLPYAMAFDCVHRWVAAFERMGVPAAAATGGWYVGHGPWDFGRVSSSMSSLSSQVGGSMGQTASSGGSSGFSGGVSGGGAGGGGGGRW